MTEPGSYDSDLCDYYSTWFSVGHAEGFKGQRRLKNPPLDSDLSEVEWASYCEGWLMGHCEGVLGNDEQEAKWYVEVATGEWTMREEMCEEIESPNAHFARLKAAVKGQGT